MSTSFERTLYLTNTIEANNIAEINKALLKIIKEDNAQEQKLKNYTREPIELYINSFGGSVYDALSLVDIISNSNTPIHTICTGYAMSAGFILFISGHKRIMSKHATLMLHQCSQSVNGKIGDLETSLVEGQRMQKTLENIITTHSKITPKMLEENRKTKTDWFITLEEAKKLNCVDEELIEI